MDPIKLPASKEQGGLSSSRSKSERKEEDLRIQKWHEEGLK